MRRKVLSGILREKPGLPLGELLKKIHAGEMSMAQASHYGHSYHNIESAMIAIFEIEHKAIAMCANVAERVFKDERTKGHFVDAQKIVADAIRKSRTEPLEP